MRKNDPNAGISREKINRVKDILTEIKNTGKQIHVNLLSTRAKLKNVPADIINVYPAFITIRSQVKNAYELFTITYVDILIKNVEIMELELS